MAVAVFGEALFDLIEAPAGDIIACIGGSPFNVARSFVRQGVPCTYVAPFSTDRYGQKLFDYAQAEGMQLPPGNRSELLTSLALVYTDESGQPDYNLYRSQVADLDVDPAKLLGLIPEDITLFHTGSLALVPSMLETLEYTFKALKNKGVKISVDVNMRKGVVQDNQAYIDAVNTLVTYADIVKVSDEDLSLLGESGNPLDAANRLLSRLNNAIVLLTEGADGATVMTHDYHSHLPVYAPEKFIDAVGAGDTFFSAFLSEYLRLGGFSNDASEKTTIAALRFGLMAATINVQRKGCQPPAAAEVRKALQTV
jgi:fructokinase